MQATGVSSHVSPVSARQGPNGKKSNNCMSILIFVLSVFSVQYVSTFIVACTKNMLQHFPSLLNLLAMLLVKDSDGLSVHHGAD